MECQDMSHLESISPTMNSKPADTLLWWNGQPEKPVFSKVCESRWQIRGTLENCIPKRGHGSRYRSSTKMRHMVANLDIYRNTRLAKAEYARRSEGKGAGWMGLGVTTSQASDGSESWTAKGSSLGTVRSGLQDLLDVAIKTGSDDHQEGNITGKDPGGLSQVDDHDSDGVLDPSDKFPHITWLKKELGLYEREKPSMMEEEVLISYVNPFLYGNEIGHGCFLLKPPQPMEEQLRMLIIRSSKTMDRFKLPASTALVLTGIPRVIIHLGRWVL